MPNSERAIEVSADMHSHRGSERRTGILDFVFSTLARTAGAPLAFVGNILIARLLGPEDFGLYMTLLSVALVAGGLASFGLGPVLTREIAATDPEQQGLVVRSLGQWAFRFGAILSVVTILITVLWFALGPGAPITVWPDRVSAVIIIPLVVLSTLVTGILGGLSRVAQSQAVGTVWKNGFLLAGVILLLIQHANKPAYVLLIQALSFGLATAIGMYWIKRAVAEPIFNRATLARRSLLDWKRQRKLWRAARHFLAISLAWLALGRLDVVIVNSLAGSTQAGFFGVAARLGQVAGMAGLVWIAWLQPRMSTYYFKGQYDALRHLFQLGLIGSVTMTATLVAIGWFGAPSLMDLMGTGFAKAVIPFRWVLLGYLAWAVSVPFYVYLQMAGRESVLSRILWLQVIVTLIASFPLVYGYGALGAAWAWSGGLTLGSLMIIVTASLYLRYRVDCG